MRVKVSLTSGEKEFNITHAEIREQVVIVRFEKEEVVQPIASTEDPTELPHLINTFSSLITTPREKWQSPKLSLWLIGHSDYIVIEG